MDLSKGRLCFIFVGILISDTYGLQPPRYVSEWFEMSVTSTATAKKTLTHGFGVLPYMHDVQVKSPSGFIYPGIRSGDGDDENSAPHGGVICIYNDNDVSLFSAYGSGSRVIYTGTTSYTNQNQESVTSASVRVRLWHPDDFPTPSQILEGIDLRAGDDTNNYEVHGHTLGQVPALTVVQFAFTYLGATWYGEAMGSSNHLAITASAAFNWGGIVFGVDSSNVRLWAPSVFQAGGVINICDGWGSAGNSGGTDCFPTSGDYAVITIRMWKSLCSARAADLTTFHTIGDSADNHEYLLGSPFNVDTDLVIVESVAVDGEFSGSHFYATGAAIFDGAGALGGMIYAYNGSAVRLWHPVTAGSYLIKVGEHMGPSTGYAHVSTQTNTIIRIWKGGIGDGKGTFNIQPGTLRDTSQISEEVVVRSRIHCASACTEDCACKGANYRAQSDGSGVCRLFSDSAVSGDLSADTNWKYMYREENNRK